MYLRKKASHGYILVLALMITGALTILIMSVYQRVAVYQPYTHAISVRQKADLLALTGLTIAIEMLNKIIADAQAQAQAKSPSPQEKTEQIDARLELITLLNKWHDFKFEQTEDNFLGSLKLYIASEQGKINLLNLYDKQNKKFNIHPTLKVDAEKLLNELGSLSPIQLGKKGALTTDIAVFNQQRLYEIQDITELLAVPALSFFKQKIFVEPELKFPFLTDLFCLQERGIDINPLIISSSLKTLLGFKEVDFTKKENKEQLKKILDQLAKANSWVSIWDNSLAKLYGKNWKDIPENIARLFVTQFEPILFSVLSYAQVGSLKQKVSAYIVLNIEEQKKRFVIKRIYWI